MKHFRERLQPAFSKYADSLAAGVDLATVALDQSRALDVLNKLVEISNG